MVSYSNSSNCWGICLPIRSLKLLNEFLLMLSSMENSAIAKSVIVCTICLVVLLRKTKAKH